MQFEFDKVESFWDEKFGNKDEQGRTGTRGRYPSKAEWGVGPWQREADKYEWRDSATGLPCLIVRNRFGALCGYVGVSEGHPYFGVKYSDCATKECTWITPQQEFAQHKKWREEARAKGEHVMPDWPLSMCRGHYDYDCTHRPESKLDAHGGITYSDKCSELICHTPKAGESEEVWWFGFDCAHSGDRSPAMESLECLRDLKKYHEDDTYRTVGYVVDQCSQLAEQLAALKNG